MVKVGKSMANATMHVRLLLIKRMVQYGLRESLVIIAAPTRMVIIVGNIRLHVIIRVPAVVGEAVIARVVQLYGAVQK
jgi:cystathionine beta-lyase family protein involved in aluminum resistance